MYVYARYCPVAAASSLIGDYWTPLILRELLLGTGRFNQLARNVPGVSRTILSARLQALERAGMVRRDPAGYVLTEAGLATRPIIDAMSDWGQRWGAPSASDEESVDGLVAVCMLKSRLRIDALPSRRVVIQVDVTGSPDGRAWIVIDRGQVSMCFDPPGFETDMFAQADARTLYRVWLQQLSVREALRAGSIRLEGPSELVLGFAGWFEVPGRQTYASAPAASPILRA